MLINFGRSNRLCFRPIVIILMLLLTATAGVLAVDQSNDDYFRNSIRAFFGDDYEEATRALEIALSYEPESARKKK